MPSHSGQVRKNGRIGRVSQVCMDGYGCRPADNPAPNSPFRLSCPLYCRCSARPHGGKPYATRTWWRQQPIPSKRKSRQAPTCAARASRWTPGLASSTAWSRWAACRRRAIHRHCRKRPTARTGRARRARPRAIVQPAALSGHRGAVATLAGRNRPVVRRIAPARQSGLASARKAGLLKVEYGGVRVLDVEGLKRFG